LYFPSSLSDQTRQECPTQTVHRPHPIKPDSLKVKQVWLHIPIVLQTPNSSIKWVHDYKHSKTWSWRNSDELRGTISLGQLVLQPRPPNIALPFIFLWRLNKIILVQKNRTKVCRYCLIFLYWSIQYLAPSVYVVYLMCHDDGTQHLFPWGMYKSTCSYSCFNNWNKFSNFNVNFS
jgi:hypothetical protein